MPDDAIPPDRGPGYVGRPDPRHAILLEPVRIGPVTTRNRFYGVPHCTGMGHRHPRSDAALRAVKAEGGWGVVSTQECEIHPSSDLSPAPEARLWDDRDVPALALVAEGIHAHGALAAIEIAHNGLHASNRLSRVPPLAPSHAASDTDDPQQARAMDLDDIRALRGWYRDAARRARTAGFDILYVYAGHDMSLLQHFLSRRHNHRADAYGGPIENRLRLLREVVEDTRDVAGDRCAVAIRLAVEEFLGDEGITPGAEGREAVEAMAEWPDLWDVNVSGWSNDSQTSRFSPEGYQEEHVAFVKSLTTRPIVGVGRYTSPDAMASAVRRGVMDLVGAARPSIADPFLPRKVAEGRADEIRECIGCNVCISGDNLCVPMRCTQNPTIGEEWRRGWHPERARPFKAPQPGPVLVVGGGPAGLEAARALAARGASVTMAEAGREWGGRVSREARLPGLAAWGRVRDWRLGRLRAMDVPMHLGSRLDAQDILDLGPETVALATGARWRIDGVARTHRLPLPWIGNGPVLSPDDLIDRGAAALTVPGPVVVFDDDRGYLASVLADLLIAAGHQVTYVTPAPVVAAWTAFTLEQARIQARLIEGGAAIHALHGLAGRGPGTLDLACVYTGRRRTIACGTLVPVTARLPVDGLWHDLVARRADWEEAGLRRVVRIGDALAPGLIAAAVYAGHAFAAVHGEAEERGSGHAWRREEVASGWTTQT